MFVRHKKVHERNPPLATPLTSILNPPGLLFDSPFPGFTGSSLLFHGPGDVQGHPFRSSISVGKGADTTIQGPGLQMGPSLPNMGWWTSCFTSASPRYGRAVTPVLGRASHVGGAHVTLAGRVCFANSQRDGIPGRFVWKPDKSELTLHRSTVQKGLLSPGQPLCIQAFRCSGEGEPSLPPGRTAHTSVRREGGGKTSQPQMVLPVAGCDSLGNQETTQPETQQLC